jgi:hypothetical protein
MPGGTSKRETETDTQSEPRAETPDEPVVERWKKPQKQALKVQSAIYTSHKISSSFDISHTINLLLISTWVGFELNHY